MWVRITQLAAWFYILLAHIDQAHLPAVQLPINFINGYVLEYTQNSATSCGSGVAPCSAIFAA
jgi:hypothetical protein